jgi:large subunit ribosomal protein L14e
MHEGSPKRESKVGKMIEIGRLCIKTAGRDAGLKCVVTEVVDATYVKIDGQTRARKCNIGHLEPLGQVLELKKNAGHEDVLKAFKKIGVEIEGKKEKETSKAEKSPKPSKKRGNSVSEPKKAKEADKQPKKAKK